MNQRLVPVVVVALVLVAGIVSITPWPVGAIQDDATYVILAKSLATGEGYRQLNLPDAPRVTHYPPGYPLLLAGLWKLWPDFPNNVVLFKYVNAVLLACAALGAYFFAGTRLQLGALGAGAAVLGGTACFLVLYVTGVVLSEPLFLALLFPALIVSERAARDGKIAWAATAGALGGVLTLVRTIGIALFPALLLTLLARRQWRAAGAAALAGLCVLAPWQLWSATYGGDVPAVILGKYGSYLGWMLEGYRQGGWSFATAVIGKNLVALRQLLDYLVMPVSAGWARIPTFVAAMAIALFGLTRLTTRAPVMALFVLGYFVIMLLWPFEVHRFLMAGFPLLALVFAVGVAEVWRARPQTPPALVLRATLIAGALVATGGFLWYNARGYSQQLWAVVQQDSGERIGAVASWVRRNTSPSDVVAVQDDPAVYLYTGRRAVPVNDFEATDHWRASEIGDDLANVNAIIQRYRPRFYIVAWQNTRLAADSLSRAHPELLHPVDRIGNATVYRTSHR